MDFNDQMNMYESLSKQWKPLLESKKYPQIKDSYRKRVTSVLLENQKKFLRESSDHHNKTGNVDKWDPILISLVRRAAPQLIAYDICGVQPMSGPTGLVFALRAAYGKNGGSVEAAQENEALGLTEPASAFSGTSALGQTSSVGTQDFSFGVSGASRSDLGTTNAIIGRGLDTAIGERLGSANNEAFNEMSINIDKTSVEAKTRGLKAEYTMELEQDLKALHGLDAQTELANMLSTEILAEINREIIRLIYKVAKTGAQQTTTAGAFDLQVDSDGRWSVERFKGLLFQIERECNAIAKETRRGKGNFIITSSDVAAALAMAGVLDYAPALQSNLEVDDTGNTFAGTINGRIKVFIDPYHSASANNEYFVAGYKGPNAMDAGLFYCPYVPLQMVQAVGEDTFQPKIGFKTRYGVVANPFVVNGSNTPDAQNMTANINQYYRYVHVANLLA
jgi:hypothetical protein